jgi:hypothetical protein
MENKIHDFFQLLLLLLFIFLGFVDKKFWHDSPPPYLHVCILYLYTIYKCIMCIIHINAIIHQGLNPTPHGGA